MVDVVRTEAEVSWANGERVSLDLVRRVVCADQSGKEKDGQGAETFMLTFPRVSLVKPALNGGILHGVSRWTATSLGR